MKKGKDNMDYYGYCIDDIIDYSDSYENTMCSAWIKDIPINPYTYSYKVMTKIENPIMPRILDEKE